MLSYLKPTLRDRRRVQTPRKCCRYLKPSNNAHFYISKKLSWLASCRMAILCVYLEEKIVVNDD